MVIEILLSFHTFRKGQARGLAIPDDQARQANHAIQLACKRRKFVCPVGEVKTTPAPPPVAVEEPSNVIVQFSSFSAIATYSS